MNIGKIFGVTALLLASIIATAVFFKGSKENQNSESIESIRKVEAKEEIPLAPQVKSPIKAVKGELIEVSLDTSVKAALPEKNVVKVIPKENSAVKREETESSSQSTIPVVDNIEALFSTKSTKFPFIETIVYKSRVGWLKGRPAWISDYASYYETSRHFIARSINGKPDYFKQEVAEGGKFNVFKKDYPVSFHLVVDATQCKLLLFVKDGVLSKNTLLKTYNVTLGRKDSSKPSGLLTPLGKYSLGSRIAIYKPSVMGHHKGEKIEMIQVYGTRWIPFDKELSDCTAPAKGFGLHGVPWVKDKKGELTQETASLGKYESDGCIRMSSEDIEELFAIVITKPASIEIVKDYKTSEMAR